MSIAGEALRKLGASHQDLRPDPPQMIDKRCLMATIKLGREVIHAYYRPLPVLVGVLLRLRQEERERRELFLAP